MRFPTFKHERKYLAKYHFVAGCDEVGIGPLAGPVVAATCILNPQSIGVKRTKNKWYYRVRDSKTTSEEERQILLKSILENSISYGVGIVWQEDIDRLNIHNAALEAMRLATENLFSKIKTNKKHKILILVDGKFKIPNIAFEQKSIITGDAQILSIAAASIIAKVHRDNIMHKLDLKFPGYGLAKHKGYGTKAHHDAIKKLGILPIHRRTFLKI